MSCASSDLNQNWVEFQPRGFRDVYWCPFLNEPVILQYRDERPYCVGCDQEMAAEDHTFICHIRKPT